MDVLSSQYSFLLLAMAYIMQAEKLIMLSACCITIYHAMGIFEASGVGRISTSTSSVFVSYMADALLTGGIKCYKTTFSSTLG